MRPIRLLGLIVLGCLALNACQKEASSLDQVKEAASDIASHGEDMASAVKDLSRDKIQEIAEIAAKLESAPEEAKKMLEEKGWTKDEFDKMVAAIHDNPELNKMFEAAKGLASKH